jgi:ABC-type sugar transport system ATPase subunit
VRTVPSERGSGIRFLGITKRFPGVTALSDVSFDVQPGSCHAICGENGAGKSTLGRILAGLQAPDEGEIRIDGAPVRFASPRDALAAGVAMVHQELAFCDNLTVADNLSLGRIPSRWTFVERNALHARAAALLAAVNAHIEPDRPMHELSIAEQQLVQVAAAVGAGARVIIFDEPTSSLGEGETRNLYALIRSLAERSVTVLYVSHRMPEIFALCDHVTVLRDGHRVNTHPIAQVSEATLVQLMIGRNLEQYFPAHVNKPPGDERLRVDRLTSNGRFADVSFSLHAGEVLGLAGLVGAGRSEIARAIFGLDPVTRGTVTVRGKPARIQSARDAMALGIGLVPEDRKRQGLVLAMCTRENTTLPVVERFARFTWVNRSAESAEVRADFDRLNVRSTPETITASLSGGNQQKIVLAKWLGAHSDILILDEPTRGVDVGAKAELHAWIDRLAEAGTAILLISSELPELLNMSTRILVLHEGRLVGEMARERATQDALLRMMAGLKASSSGDAGKPVGA